MELHELGRISGYLALGAFVLNFATCYAMPWSKDKCPWKGSRPGHDCKDSEGRKTFSYYHHYFTWLTIFFVIAHLILVNI